MNHNHQLEPINNNEKSSKYRRFQDINEDLNDIEKKFENIEKKINFNAKKSFSLNEDES